MLKCQHITQTCCSHQRFYAVNVDDMSPSCQKTTLCANTSDKTTTLTTEITLKYIFQYKTRDKNTVWSRKRLTKKTTRRANTSDKTTTIPAENALKYIDFNIKRMTKTPCGCAERLTKRHVSAQKSRHSLHKNAKTNVEMVIVT